MKLCVKLHESDVSFKATFSSVVEITGIDYDHVYNLGFNNGYTQGFDACKAEASDSIQAAYNKGREAERNEFWEAFQQSGNRKSYRYAFYSQGTGFWTDDIYNLIYPLDCSNAYGADSMFQAAQIIDTKVDIIIGTNASYTFLNCDKLVTIRKLIVSENTTYSRWFDGCTALVNLTFEGVIAKNGLNLQWSTNLSHDSLMSIIYALQDKSVDTSGTNWIVTIGNTNRAKLTVEEIAIAEKKGWELV